MNFVRPTVEQYLRVDVTIDGTTIDVGLEDRCSDDPAEHERMLTDMCNVASAGAKNARELCGRVETLLVDVFPDRYYFVEVWNDAMTPKRYQVIQPAVVGGFRR